MRNLNPAAKKAVRPTDAGAPELAAVPMAPAGTGVSDAAAQPFAVPVLHRPATRRVANRKRTLAVFAGALAALVLVVAVGLAVGDAATKSDFTRMNLSPCLEHPFGTDWLGRDMFLRTLSGLSTSILVGLLAAGVSSLIALVLGAVAALGGKKADAVVTWLIDLMMGVPHIVLLILISYALGKGFWGVTIGVAVTHWPSLTRVIRAEIRPALPEGYSAVYAMGETVRLPRYGEEVTGWTALDGEIADADMDGKLAVAYLDGEGKARAAGMTVPAVH